MHPPDRDITLILLIHVTLWKLILGSSLNTVESKK